MPTSPLTICGYLWIAWYAVWSYARTTGAIFPLLQRRNG
jgi:hypothetical protein